MLNGSFDLKLNRLVKIETTGVEKERITDREKEMIASLNILLTNLTRTPNSSDIYISSVVPALHAYG